MTGPLAKKLKLTAWSGQSNSISIHARFCLDALQPDIIETPLLAAKLMALNWQSSPRVALYDALTGQHARSLRSAHWDGRREMWEIEDPHHDKAAFGLFSFALDLGIQDQFIERVRMVAASHGLTMPDLPIVAMPA